MKRKISRAQAARNPLCDMATPCPKAPLFDQVERKLRTAVPGFQRQPCTEAIEGARRCGVSTNCGFEALRQVIETAAIQAPKKK